MHDFNIGILLLSNDEDVVSDITKQRPIHLAQEIILIIFDDVWDA